MSANNVCGKTQPYKVCNCDKTKRKGIVASSLQELIDKGSCKLGLDGDADIQVLLETDGTEVDDEDYFSFLEPQTSFVFLLPEEEYILPGMRLEELDEPDGGAIDFTGVADASITEIIKVILSDITKIVTLSPNDIQRLLEVDEVVLSRILDPYYGPKTAQKIKNACQRFQDEHQQAKEYISVIELIKQAQSKKETSDKTISSESSDEIPDLPTGKRRRQTDSDT